MFRELYYAQFSVSAFTLLHFILYNRITCVCVTIELVTRYSLEHVREDFPIYTSLFIDVHHIGKLSMASLFCSFVTFSKEKCNISPRYPKVTEYFPLTSCKRDIRSHLRTVKVSQTSILSEKDLILAPTGQFNEDGTNMTICPRHRAEHGMFWPPSRKCAHPLHGNRKGKPERGATLEMSKEIMLKWNTLIPVGAGKRGIYSCLPHFKILNAPLVQSQSQDCSEEGVGVGNKQQSFTGEVTILRSE